MKPSFFDRIATELRHWTRKAWTFADVGAHWDATEDYDEINEGTYSYFRRFTDGFRVGDLQENGRVLDLCSRTGNGTLFFYEKGIVRTAVCADVSVKMGEICAARLKAGGFDEFEWVQIHEGKLPFEDASFDTVLCFETVEHICSPEALVAELGRVTRAGGKMLLTTPNVFWEPLHALAAILNLHHSEGPHRFIRRARLVSMIQGAGFEIASEETTVLIPGGPRWLLRLSDWVEAHTRRTLMPLLGLRRIFACRKT